MKMQMMGKCLVVCLVLVFGVAGTAAEDSSWTGAGADNLWDNPNNWADGMVPGVPDLEGDIGDAGIDGPAGAAPNGPLIQDGIEAVTGTLYTEAGEPLLTMTGGSLELVGWGVWWGDGGNNHSVWDMSGGYVNFTGSPGIFEMGWQSGDDIDAGKTVSGTLNMTGGRIDVKGLSWPDKSPEDGASAMANLGGGRLNVGRARPEGETGMNLRDGARVDLTEGLLVLEGDPDFVADDVQFFIDEGYLVAYDGQGEIVITAGMAGDNDQDDDADGIDFLKWQQADGTEEGLALWTDSFGLSLDPAVEFNGWTTVSAVLPAAVENVPEPAAAALAIFCLCCCGYFGRRRHA